MIYCVKKVAFIMCRERPHFVKTDNNLCVYESLYKSGEGSEWLQIRMLTLATSGG